ncbi:MAG: hypothetical protein WDO15_22045 [Bacteroidota bacterium]
MMTKVIKKLFGFVQILLAANAFSQTLPAPVQLPNGWKLTPAGESMPLGDLPLNMVVSPSSKYIAITNNGQGIQTIELIDIAAKKKVDSVVIARSWYGLTFSPDEKYLYASGGHDNVILQYELQKGKLALKDTIRLGAAWPNRIGPAGIEIDGKRGRLYVVTREDKALYVIDLKTKTTLGKYGIDAEGYACS